MWINMTTSKVSEAYEKEGLPVLYSQKNMKVMTGAKGFVAGYAIFLHGDHSQGCSLSIWESQADAEAWFASKPYIDMVNEVIRHILGKPVRQGWDVALDMNKVAKGSK